MAPPVELHRLLDLCDEIRVLRRRILDTGLEAEAVTRFKRRSKTKWKRLALDLGSYRFRGSLRSLLDGLDAQHFLLLATLLRRYLRSQTPYIEGRALLASVFDSSYELLAGLELLQPEAALRANGLIVAESVAEDIVVAEGFAQDAAPEGQEEGRGEDAAFAERAGEAAGEDLLDMRFRLADCVVDGFLEELGLKGAKRKARQVRCYSKQEEFLVDLKLLHNLYRARAKRLFTHEMWWRLRAPLADRSYRAIDRQIVRLGRQIDARLERSPAALRFPVRQFQLEHGLNIDEFLVVLHMLFLEMLEGNPYADVVALLQLVSGSEEEFLSKRELFSPRGKLRRLDIVELDQMLEGRELTSECHLGNWVLERILGSHGEEGPIDADEKLEFHLYLKRLGSSNFLQDL